MYVRTYVRMLACLYQHLLSLSHALTNVVLHSFAHALTFRAPLTVACPRVTLVCCPPPPPPISSSSSMQVHRANWRGSEVAVKVFHMGQLSERSMASFHAELLVMSCMRHPNIVLLMGACRTPRPCIVMEYMRGGSLSSLIHLKKKRLSLENVVMVLQDVSRGLQYLHSINILHRDLKSKVCVCVCVCVCMCVYVRRCE